MNPNGLLSGVGRVMGRYESRQWRSVMAVATTTSPELRPTTATRVNCDKRDDLDNRSTGLPSSQLISSPSSPLLLLSSSPPLLFSSSPLLLLSSSPPLLFSSSPLLLLS